MAALLQLELDVGEISKLPKNIVNKVERLLEEQQYKLDSLKAQHEQLRVDNEQHFFEKVQQLDRCQKDFVAKSKEHSELTDKFSKLEEELKAAVSKNRDYATTQDRLSSDQVVLSKAREELEAEKRELVRTLEIRSSEVEHLNEDLRQLNYKLVTAGTSEITLQMKLDELETAQVNIKYKEQCMDQEKELLQGQLSWLKDQLQGKSQELRSLSRQKGSELLELRCSLDNKEYKLCKIQDHLRSSKASNENLQKQNKDLFNELKEARDQALQATKAQALQARVSVELLEARLSWKEQEKILKEEMAKVESRGEELQKQNSLLHEQIQTLSRKMPESLHRATGDGALNISLTEEGESQEQVLEILRFVRCEKEIAESRFEMAQGDSLRYRLRVEHLERELKEVQDNQMQIQSQLRRDLQLKTTQEEKMKKELYSAKQKISQLMAAKDQQEVKVRVVGAAESRVGVLTSQFEDLSRQEREREPRDLRGHQERQGQRDEPAEAGPSKAQEQQRSGEQRQISLKTTPAADRGSASSSEPPTANIKPTPVPSSSKQTANPGNKATPRASIPMITPAPVPTPTPTTTVMPTTQVETQEAMQSEAPPVEHVTVYGSASGSVRSSSPNVLTTLSSPMLTVQQVQSQATAFVQPTQQQNVSHSEPANQEPPPMSIEAPPTSSSPMEWPSTSSSVFGTEQTPPIPVENGTQLKQWVKFAPALVSATPGSSMSKRSREEEESSTVVTEAEDTSRAPKKLRIIQRVGPEEEMLTEDSAEAEGVVPSDSQDATEASQGADVTDPGTEAEENVGVSDSTQRPADSQTPSYTSRNRGRPSRSWPRGQLQRWSEARGRKKRGFARGPYWR